jgi:hypothetical protein
MGDPDRQKGRSEDRMKRAAIAGVVVAVTVFGALTIASATSGAQEDATCAGKAATIVGSDTDATTPLETTPADDVVVLNRAPSIVYAGGTDLVCGRSGDTVADTVVPDTATSE